MIKPIIIFFLSCNLVYSQDTTDVKWYKNLEVFYSPIQTRIGGIEYKKDLVNDEVGSNSYSYVKTYKEIDFEIGLNYLFKIKKANLSAGLSYYSDSYKFFFNDRRTNKLYRINTRGLSINMSYRKTIFKGTSIDLGINTRLETNFRFNRNDYGELEILSTIDLITNEKWSYSNSISFIPTIQFNTNIYKGLFLKYGVYGKFWGNTFYSVQSSKKSNNEMTLDFSANESILKATIAIGYRFNN